MDIVMFVSNAGSTSGIPGKSQNTLRLQLPPKSDRVDDNNTEAFPDPSVRNGVVEFQGLSDELLAQAKAGQRAKVTITFED